MRGAIALFLFGVVVAACTTDPSTTSEVNGRHSCRGSNQSLFRRNKVLNLQPFRNPHGTHATYSNDNSVFMDTRNPFFQELGTNGRTCATCHSFESGFGLS